MWCFHVSVFIGRIALILRFTVVSNGRVAKSTPSGKSSKKNILKQEGIENSFDSMMSDGFPDIDSTHEGLGALDFENGMAMTNLYD